jgi:hypothetical protein
MTRRPSWWRAIWRVDAENPPGAALCRRARAAPYDVGGGRAGDGGLVDECEFALDAAHLIGIAVLRYVVKVNGVVQASDDEIVALVAPAISGYLR